MTHREERELKQTITHARKELKWHHKVLYALLVFVGMVMIWYGMWNVISHIPFFSNPWISLGSGLIVLSFTGALYKHLSGGF